MQFIVEDGTGLDNSNSYSSVEAADDYATFWDNQDWLTLTEIEKQRLLIKATSYFDQNLDYPSSILKLTQSLGYPRKNYLDKDGREITGIPSKLVEAVIRLAALFEKGFVPNQQMKVLTSQSYGNSSEAYAGTFIENLSEYDIDLAQIIRGLASLGLGFKSIRQIDVVRG